jgi:chromate reductase
VTEPTIITVCGSLRRASIHAALLRSAEEHLERLGARVERDDGIRTIPHYDQDLDDPPPPEIARRRERIGVSSGVLLACPAYNGSVTGAMKDWIDWVSRPFGRSVLQGVPLAVITASPGSKGGVQAATYLERITKSLGARLVADPLTIANVGSALDGDGNPDEPTDAAIRRLVESLLAPPPDASA